MFQRAYRIRVAILMPIGVVGKITTPVDAKLKALGLVTMIWWFQAVYRLNGEPHPQGTQMFYCGDSKGERTKQIWFPVSLRLCDARRMPNGRNTVTTVRECPCPASAID